MAPRSPRIATLFGHFDMKTTRILAIRFRRLGIRFGISHLRFL
ncbi:MAG: hypothetical protein ACLGGV_08745 [Bacteroidia bacterium]